jgi:hypothetical protein
MGRKIPDTVAFRERNAFKLMTAANVKTQKGEKQGYFSAILYLSPHMSGGGATLCPYSTPACREMCLAGAGMSGLPLQLQAKINRTRLFNDDRETFFVQLRTDLAKLERIARREGMKPVARLNGTSDIMWERFGIMDDFPAIQFYGYTKIPLRLHRVTANHHLTFSIEGPDTMALGVDYLRGGHSVAVVVPPEVKDRYAGHGLIIGGEQFHMIDGDEDDLRFLDPPGSIVLLKPKGHVRTSLLRPEFALELADAA